MDHSLLNTSVTDAKISLTLRAQAIQPTPHARRSICSSTFKAMATRPAAARCSPASSGTQSSRWRRGREITSGDLITTNYCGPFYQAGPFQVIEVRRDCRCKGHRQRLPHWHITAEDLGAGGRCWFNGYVLDREGRLRHTARMTHRIGSDDFDRIHPEILLVEKAQQPSLF